jgi:hypothetical protein
VEGSYAGGGLEAAGSFVVEGGGEHAEVSGDEDELRLAVIEGDDAMVDAVEDAGGLAVGVAEEPLGGGGGDVDLDDGGAELSAQG